VCFRQSKQEYISPEGLRLDGRRAGEIRRLAVQLGALPNADGSVLFQQGNTKVVCSVFGPHEVRRMLGLMCYCCCCYGVLLLVMVTVVYLLQLSVSTNIWTVSFFLLQFFHDRLSNNSPHTIPRLHAPQCRKRSQALHDRAIVNVHYTVANFSRSERKPFNKAVRVFLHYYHCSKYMRLSIDYEGLEGQI
jgi:hypothetical protein